MEIDGDSYKDAIKNFIKLNYAMNLNKIIIHDRHQDAYHQAKFNYYQKDNKNKVGIDIYPMPGFYLN
tara:strand:+ start:2470 stop:2670 length:201 start_codon:yes stop_codon:yes gene_type:complete